MAHVFFQSIIRFEKLSIGSYCLCKNYKITVPRATDPAHHNKVIQDIVSNLGVLEQSGLFDEVRLCSRTGECLYPLVDDPRTASEALSSVLFGPWTSEEEEHYNFLKETLVKLKNKEAGTSRCR